MSRTDPRPYTKADDAYLMLAAAEGVGYRAMARAVGRSVASVRGRVKRLRSEPAAGSTCSSSLSPAGFAPNMSASDTG